MLINNVLYIQIITFVYKCAANVIHVSLCVLFNKAIIIIHFKIIKL
jgi:hypothetical protein